MKCLCCGTVSEGMSCPVCGEASWGETQLQVIEVDQAPVEIPFFGDVDVIFPDESEEKQSN